MTTAGGATTLVDALAAACGWLYFLAWSASFYPQLLLNVRRGSVRGLSLDFVLLNVTGFCAYAAYTSLLFWYAPVRAAFAEVHAGLPPQVAPNDVVFGLHGAAICVLVVMQCALYPRGGQTVRRVVAVGCAAAWAGMVVMLAAGARGAVGWMAVLHVLGFVKVVGSFFKYTPQVVLNFQRKSTAGFAVAGITLDFMGGVLSIAQQLLTSYSLGSWAPVTTNGAKTALALETLFFDAILLLQHYVLYMRAPGPLGFDAPALDGDEYKPLDDQSAQRLHLREGP